MTAIDVTTRASRPAPGFPGAHRSRRPRLRDRRRLRRDVRGRDRPDGRRPGPDHPDRAPVPDHRGIPGSRGYQPLPTLRDPDQLVYWRQEVDGLLMGGYERNPAPWSVSSTPIRRRPGRFQRPAAGRGLAPVRVDRGELSDPGADHHRGRDPQAGQRPGGVHPGQRVLPGRDRGRRLLRRGRLLRARDRRRGRDRPGDGGVDRRRGAGLRRLAHGPAAVRAGLRLALVRAGPRGRVVRHLLRRGLPGAGTDLRPPVAHLPAYPWHAGTAPSSARRPAGNG